MSSFKLLQNGIPHEKIHLHFNFLKYCTITYEQANGKIKSTNVERRLLGEKLQSPCKMWLKKFGYDVLTGAIADRIEECFALNGSFVQVL